MKVPNLIQYLSLILAISTFPTVTAATETDAPGENRQVRDAISPARQIEPGPRQRQQARANAARFRSIDGTGNNLEEPEMGAALTQLNRILPSDYDDGISSLAGAGRASARVISNHVANQDGSIPNPNSSTDFLWQWGQFLDHDISLTDGTEPPEPTPIEVAPDDSFFIPGPTMAFNRSHFDPNSSPRQQINEITSWIDASNVYGSDQDRADALRTFDGTGRLKTSEDNLLPFNELALPNAGGTATNLFLAGDVRANEQLGLIAMHTLFVREHNRLADEIAQSNPGMTGEDIYQQARNIVAAQMQVITYREFLPTLLGRNALSRYRGYDRDIDGAIANEFSSGAYRFGHSALSTTLLRINADGSENEFGHLPLRDAFFRPDRIINEGGIDPILRGLASQVCQRIDVQLVDDVRNFLFGVPPAAGFDLAALNIQRGRDHGLPDYNTARAALGLTPATSFADITNDTDMQARLAAAYENIDSVDLWVGGLAEDKVEGSQLGELFHLIIVNQFESLRGADRFWYTRTLSREQRRRVERTRLSDIIRRNTDIGDELPDNVFRLETS